jgi:hypothetical protein
MLLLNKYLNYVFIAYRVLVGKPVRNRPLDNTGVDGRIILRWVFKK